MLRELRAVRQLWHVRLLLTSAHFEDLLVFFILFLEVLDLLLGKSSLNEFLLYPIDPDVVVLLLLAEGLFELGKLLVLATQDLLLLDLVVDHHRKLSPHRIFIFVANTDLRNLADVKLGHPWRVPRTIASVIIVSWSINYLLPWLFFYDVLLLNI